MKKPSNSLVMLALLLYYSTSIAQISWQPTCGATYLPVAENAVASLEMSIVPDTVIIPVVFHILTQGGVENISKEQVLDALRILNEDFSNRNPDTLDIPAPFENVRGNPKIEFRLARIDPDGACTDGIERIYTPYTYGPGGTGNHYNLQPIFDWDHKRYMNIYVVNWIETPNDFNISGIAYITPVESVASHPEFNDALTICYDALGDGFNGLPRFYYGSTLSHEMGHFVGLHHPWGPNDSNPNCNDDDQVTDTPKQKELNNYCPTFPHISCNNGPNGDMFNNYMDYTDCRNMFSKGQVDRIRNCFGAHPWRIGQWTNENQILTGIKNPLPACEMAPVADFGYGNSANWLGAGNTINFNEACSWDPDNFFWEFEGGIPATSTEKFPKIIFQDSGFHQVTLTVLSDLGTSSISKQVFVSPAEIYYDAAMAESFENDEEANNLVLYGIRGIPWNQTDIAAKTGTKSFYNSGNSQYVSGFFTHIFNLGNTPASGRQLAFDIALGMSASGNAAAGMRVLWKRPEDFDRWELEAAPNSAIKAKTLHDGDVLTPESLVTETTNAPFIPNANQWKTISLPIPDTLTGEIQIGFLWANFIQTSKFKGLYIDDIRITNPTGVEELAQQNQVNIRPNPTKDHISLDIPLNINLENAVMRVYDRYGRLIFTRQSYQLKDKHDVSQWPAGIYFIQVECEGINSISKLVKLD